jgi:hypothetical protein
MIAGVHIEASTALWALFSFSMVLLAYILDRLVKGLEKQHEELCKVVGAGFDKIDKVLSETNSTVRKIEAEIRRDISDIKSRVSHLEGKVL